MKDSEYLVVVDIGTTKVCTLIAQKDSKNLEIIGVGSHPSHGLKKGSVVNIDKTVRSIHASLEEAKMMAGIEKIDSVTIGIAGNHIYCFNSSGVVPIKKKEISQSDIDSVLESAKAVLIPSERETLHIIPQDFRVDNTTGVKNPLGMCGTRLEAHVHVVTGKIPLIKNLIKCVEQLGIGVDNIILQPIASSRSVLTEEEKDMGVVLLDIGGGTTDMAVWKDGSIIHSQIIPVGGNHFTNDLAIGLKISHSEAERLKVNHGRVLAEKTDQHSMISVQGLQGTKPREVEVKAIAGVLGSRAEEIISTVKNILDENELMPLLSGGIVYTGGGALIKDLAILTEYLTDKPTKIGFPIPFGSMTSVMQNPKFSTVLGLLLEAADTKKTTLIKSDEKAIVANLEKNISKDFFNRMSESFKSVFKEIF